MAKHDMRCESCKKKLRPVNRILDNAGVIKNYYGCKNPMCDKYYKVASNVDIDENIVNPDSFESDNTTYENNDKTYTIDSEDTIE